MYWFLNQVIIFILQVLANVPLKEISEKSLLAPEDEPKEIVTGKKFVYKEQICWT